MPVLVVESPAKARTIGKYLGSDYKVLATYGHIRNLVRKDGSVDPEDGFRMKWDTLPGKDKHIAAITAACRNDDTLILATDRDREGEAIGWHLTEVLRQKKGKVLPDNVYRIKFDAITRNTIFEALESPGNIDTNLVEAYLTRTALDYLVGFGISPLLWRRFPVGKSAGRVQSACLRLIADRETEIEQFRSREYWTIEAHLAKFGAGDEKFTARLSVLDGKKLGKFSIKDGELAKRVQDEILKAQLIVESVERKPVNQSPAPPFITATMQQVANKALGFSTGRTMQVAQKLYEGGLISYMRTDSTIMSSEALAEARNTIRSRYGEMYCPSRHRVFKNRVRNAQEAHECIRPSSFSMTPDKFHNSNLDQKRLYELIWNRAVASQMQNAVFDNTSVVVTSSDGKIKLSANGSTRVFDGFQKLISKDPGNSGDKAEGLTDSKALQNLVVGDDLAKIDVRPQVHHTKPPARYSEATIVKEMVKLGIGRPSTYSSILTTIQDRGYVNLIKKNLVPTISGRLATVFLTEYFQKYVEYEYTANLEGELDQVANGTVERCSVLGEFWSGFSGNINNVWDQNRIDISKRITHLIAPLIKQDDENGSINAELRCSKCSEGTLVLRFSRNGGEPFLGCSAWPDCNNLSNLGQRPEIVIESEPEFPGNAPGITLKHGRYGPYIESGTQRVSLPKDIKPDDLNPDLALQLLSLPRTITPAKGDQDPIIARLGRYGPYISQGNLNARVRTTRELLALDIDQARSMLAMRDLKRGARQLGEGEEKIDIRNGRYGPYLRYKGKNIKLPEGVDSGSINHEQAISIINKETARMAGSCLGNHPSGGEINLLSGRYGPYVRWKKTNASIPTGQDPSSVTLEMAIGLLEAKQTAGKRKK